MNQSGSKKAGADKDSKKQTDNKPAQKKERPKRESVIDLSKFLDQQVRVKFQGGREASGKLKGYDQLLNLVLDDATEYMRDSEETRKIGRLVCRGPAVTIICPQDGHEAIKNPFLVDA